MLLGRPWIHPAGTIPSVLHLNVKYAIDGFLVIIHGKQEFATFGEPSILHINTTKETESASY